MTMLDDPICEAKASRPAFAPGELAGKVTRQSREVAALKESFFNQHAEKIADCCRSMAAAFDRGATLYAMGNGGSSCDATHCSVEFMHPILQKRPALPSVALTTDTAIMTAVGNDQDFSMVFAEQLRMLGRAGDMILGVSTSGNSNSINRALRLARQRGMMTIGFAGRDGGRMTEVCDHLFVVPSFSIPRIQETHQTLLHIVWDLIHVIRGEEDVL